MLRQCCRPANRVQILASVCASSLNTRPMHVTHEIRRARRFKHHCFAVAYVILDTHIQHLDHRTIGHHGQAPLVRIESQPMHSTRCHRRTASPVVAQRRRRVSCERSPRSLEHAQPSHVHTVHRSGHIAHIQTIRCASVPLKRRQPDAGTLLANRHNRTQRLAAVPQLHGAVQRGARKEIGLARRRAQRTNGVAVRRAIRLRREEIPFAEVPAFDAAIGAAGDGSGALRSADVQRRDAARVLGLLADIEQTVGGRTGRRLCGPQGKRAGGVGDEELMFKMFN